MLKKIVLVVGSLAGLVFMTGVGCGGSSGAVGYCEAKCKCENAGDATCAKTCETNIESEQARADKAGCGSDYTDAINCIADSNTCSQGHLTSTSLSCLEGSLKLLSCGLSTSSTSSSSTSSTGTGG